MQRALHRVLPRLVARDPRRLRRIAAPTRGSHEIRVLAHAQLEAELVEDASSVGRRVPKSWSAYTNAKSPTRIAVPSPTAVLSTPRHVAVQPDEALVDRSLSATAPRAVHHVVVHQRDVCSSSSAAPASPRARRPANHPLRHTPSSRTPAAGASRRRARARGAPSWLDELAARCATARPRRRARR